MVPSMPEHSDQPGPDEPEDGKANRRMLVAIYLALGIWGVLLGVGAYLELWRAVPNAGGDARKFWIVIAATAGFLLFWAVALAVRRRRMK